MKLSLKNRPCLTSPCSPTVSHSDHQASPAAQPGSVDSASSAQSADGLRNQTHVNTVKSAIHSLINPGARKDAFTCILMRNDQTSDIFRLMRCSNKQIHNLDRTHCKLRPYSFVLVGNDLSQYQSHPEAHCKPKHYVFSLSMWAASCPGHSVISLLHLKVLFSACFACFLIRSKQAKQWMKSDD